MLPPRCPVLRRDGEDPVPVDLEGHLELGDARGRRREALQPEGLELLVVCRHGPLALQHDNLDGVLCVLRRCEQPSPFRWDRSVTLNHRCEDTTIGFHAQRQWRNIDEHNVLHLARDHGGLDGGADGDDLVGVDGVVHGLVARHLPEQPLHPGHAARAAHEHNLGDVLHLELRVLQRLEDRFSKTHNEVHTHLREVIARQHLIDVLGPALVRGDERDRDPRLQQLRKFCLRALACLKHARQGLRVLSQVDPLFLLEGVGDPIDNAPIEVVASQVRVASCGQDLDDTVTDLQQ
mmetsp:Transcript_124504/g.363544  ORF Transcript_124504/g.363544 Transcript_124504/m.363544 type:complete len:292 (-) Transcript_124504:715-1590(-)